MFSIDDTSESKTIIDALNNYIGRGINIKSVNKTCLYDATLEEVHTDHLVVSNEYGGKVIIMIQQIIHIEVD